MMIFASISTQRWRRPSMVALFPIVLFVVALAPRLTALGRYITPDELVWVYRSVQFRQALLAGQWTDTLTTGHPGVITTWMGALGISLQLLFFPADEAVYEWITHVAWFTPDNTAAFTQLASFLAAGRLAVALVNSLGIVAIYGLARSLLGRSIATLGSLLLALDPFVAALSGLLHVDGLMTTFATLSLLALALTVARGDDVHVRSRHIRYAAVSGIAAALAILTKSPALLLPPFAALILFLALVRDRREPAVIGKVIKQGLTWLACFLLALFLVLPALWAAPQQVVATISRIANRHIEQALRPTFFMGQVAFDHGPLFYPVTLSFRLSPVALLGAILAFFLIVRFWLWPASRPGHQARQNEWHSLTAVVLLLWPLLFVAGISIAAKKFDRYALPVIPALTLAAAAAWMYFPRLQGRLVRFVPALLVVVQGALFLMAMPYPLAAFNPLLGGARTAEKVLTVGWGESISAAGRWLATQPGAAEKTAVAGIAPSLAPFFPGRTLLFEEENLPQADYIITTANGRQINPEGLEKLAAAYTLIHTIHFGGLDQAWIYEQANPQQPNVGLIDFDNPLSFANRVQLLATGATTTGATVRFYARWQLPQPAQQPGGRYIVKLSLRDEEGRVWSGLETALLNELYFYPEFWAAGETPQLRYTIELPPAMPPATYTVELSLFDSESGARLPLLTAGGVFQGVVYALDVTVPPPAAPPAVGELNIPIPTDVAWLDGALVLLGHAALPDAIVNGGRVPLDLYWRATAELPDGLMVTLVLDDERQAAFPLSRYDSGRWPPGAIIHEKYNLAIPPAWPAGRYQVQVMPLAAGGAPLAGSAVTLGELEVIAADRLLALPDDIPVKLDYLFGEGIQLRGLALAAESVRPGDALRLTLYWQTETQPDDLYSAFVHVVGPDGSNLAQDDRWPGGLPSDAWAAGQVIVDEYAIEIPADAPPGQYRIATGLYTAGDGLRLPVTDTAGAAYPDNRVLLPVTLTIISAEE